MPQSLGFGRRVRAVFHHLLIGFVCVGVNLLVGTESGLMLLDRSGQGKVYPLINRRRFQQMDVLEGLNLLITISGHNRCSLPFCSPIRLKSSGIFSLVHFLK